MKKKNWSRDEEDLLINCIKKGETIPIIAEKLNRSSKSVESKIWIFKQTKKA